MPNFCVALQCNLANCHFTSCPLFVLCYSATQCAIICSLFCKPHQQCSHCIIAQYRFYPCNFSCAIAQSLHYSVTLFAAINRLGLNTENRDLHTIKGNTLDQKLISRHISHFPKQKTSSEEIEGEDSRILELKFNMERSTFFQISCLQPKMAFYSFVFSFSHYKKQVNMWQFNCGSLNKPHYFYYLRTFSNLLGFD